MRKRNEWVLQKLAQFPSLILSTKENCSFIGHVTRSEGLGNNILSGMVSGKRRRGRLPRKLKNNVQGVLEWQLLDYSKVHKIETSGIRMLGVPGLVNTDPSVLNDDVTYPSVQVLVMQQTMAKQ